MKCFGNNYTLGCLLMCQVQRPLGFESNLNYTNVFFRSVNNSGYVRTNNFSTHFKYLLKKPIMNYVNEQILKRLSYLISVRIG